MISVLDACLVNGFGIQTVTSLTASGKLVTVNFGTAHNLMQHQVIKISGANQAEFNGEHRILSVPNTTSFTYEIVSTASASQATGTIVCSLPSLGWEKSFSSTSATGGKGAYRSTNLLLPSRPFLRVVDELDPSYTATYAKYAKVGIVEDMTDINTMLGVQAPYDSVNPDKNWVGTGSGATVINGWARWYYAHNATFTATTATDSNPPQIGNRTWIVVGDKNCFYILPTGNPNSLAALPYGFGAFNSLLVADSACNFLSATLNNNAANNTTNKQGVTSLTGSNSLQKIILQRGYSQSSKYVEGVVCSLGVSSTIYSGNSNYIGSASLNNLAPFAPVFINEDTLRGELSNLYWLFQNKPYSNLQIMEKNNQLYIAINIGTSATGTPGEGQIILKIGNL